MKKIIVGITGASGSIYAVRLMEVLCRRGIEIHAVVTTSGEKVLDYECGITREELSRRVTKLYANDDVGAAIASGSFRMDAMIVVPCSMHEIHLENLLRLARAGAVVMPAAPGFYHRPETVDDLVNMMVGKICDRLGLEEELFLRWR